MQWGTHIPVIELENSMNSMIDFFEDLVNIAARTGEDPVSPELANTILGNIYILGNMDKLVRWRLTSPPILPISGIFSLA